MLKSEPVRCVRPQDRELSRVITEVQAGPYTLRGLSLGGVYTTIQVRELDVLLDVGLYPRGLCAASRIFLSHGHTDHFSGLAGLLGVQGMMRDKPPPRVFLPAEIADDVRETLAVMSRIQGYELAIDAVPMRPGDSQHLGADLFVRAFRTHHRVPSRGYQFYRRVQKLRPEFATLDGAEIRDRKQAGEALFEDVERLELAYATDTLIRVLDTAPEICRSRVLILECTFLDDRKSLKDSRAGCHIHLDELLERAEDLDNEHIVLMHFSQLYSPRRVHEILDRRCPPRLRERIVPFVPARGGWPG